MKLVLHIGAPKTGSTAIQEALRRQELSWLDKGVMVCPEPHDYAFRYLGGGQFPPKLRMRFDSFDAAVDWSERCWQVLETKLAAEPPTAVVMSSEYFIVSQQKKALTERLLSLFSEVQVIAYVRDPVSNFVSMVDQAIRGGARVGDLKVFSRREHSWLPAALDKFARRFGDQRLVVRNFARHNLVEGDVVADFQALVERALGQSLPLHTKADMRNQSLCGAATAWLLTQNEMSDAFLRNKGSKFRMRLRRAEVDALRVAPGLADMPRLTLDDPVLLGFLAGKFADEIVELNTRYLSGQVQMPVGPALQELPALEVLQARLRDWLAGYLTSETEELIVRIAERARREANQRFSERVNGS